MEKDSYIDEVQLTSQFQAGEVVQLISMTRDGTVPYFGRVTAVHENIGLLDVETDFGNFRLSPLEVSQVDVKERDYFEDTGYSSWEKEKARQRQQAKDVAEDYRSKFRRVSRKVSSLKNKGFSEMKAYDILFKKHSSYYSDADIKQAVRFTYSEKRDHVMSNKKALYWKEKGRHYCPSKSERSEGVFHCPKCKTELQKATYRKYTKLYVCPDCLWMIAPEDLIDPAERKKKKEEEQKQKDFEELEDTDEDFFEPDDPRLEDDSSDKESSLMRRAVKEAARRYFDEDSEKDQLLEELGRGRKHE